MIGSYNNNVSNYYGSGSDETTIIIVADQKFAEDMTVRGRKKIVNIVSDDIEDRGRVYSTAKKVL
jgi:hypothetical protein